MPSDLTGKTLDGRMSRGLATSLACACVCWSSTGFAQNPCDVIEIPSDARQGYFDAIAHPNSANAGAVSLEVTEPDGVPRLIRDPANQFSSLSVEGGPGESVHHRYYRALSPAGWRRELRGNRFPNVFESSEFAIFPPGNEFGALLQPGDYTFRVLYGPDEVFPGSGPLNQLLVRALFSLTESFRYQPRCTNIRSGFLSDIFHTYPGYAGAPLEYKFRVKPRHHTRSFYMTSDAALGVAALGCSVGTQHRDLDGAQDDVAILLFGNAVSLPAGQYGATAYDGPNLSTAQIGNVAKNFSAWYYSCLEQDTASHLRLIVGTTSHGRGLSPAHGTAWAQMINDVGSWIAARGISGQVSAAGGIDIELDEAHGWRSPSVVKDWVRAYSDTGQYWLYNFGAADGCSTTYAGSNSACLGTWTADDVVEVSWGELLARPLPQIYSSFSTSSSSPGNMARQWQALSQRARDLYGEPMFFDASLSQSGACTQRAGTAGACRPPPVTTKCCTDATPSEAWFQLRDALDGEPSTSGRIADRATDIRWYGP